MTTAGSIPAQSSQRAGLLPASFWVALIVAGALALRLGRLAWQPLWWDEGYSVYFATEPLGRMLWLTAHDIHPPLYYALLHLWIRILGSGPVALRLLSVVIGALSVAALAWMARILFPLRPRVVWIAALLLAVNPMHVYYAQEVRMYALAMLLCIAATGWLWRGVSQLAAGLPARRALLIYALFGVLALYTLYYTALLLAAHAVWALWQLRRMRNARAASLALVATDAAIFVAYLPWLVYALPKLVAYVGQKIGADSDSPLNLLDYALRHGRTLLAGHVAPATPATWAALAISLAALLVIVILAWRSRIHPAAAASPNPVNALLLFTLLPVAAAFLLNLRLPFFPAGGERLLLFVLPFLLLLIARAADGAQEVQRVVGGVALGLLTFAGLLGVLVFYTTPRYAQDDFRPVIQQAVQQGAPGDTFLATFPWMVGYWRAYAPNTLSGPTPLLLGDSAVDYGPAVAAEVDAALARGTLWFPEPLGFGSTLPAAIVAHLRAGSLNLENRWVSLTTRLSAWTAAGNPAAQPLNAVFGEGPTLAAAGIQRAPVTAANRPIAMHLVWEKLPPPGDNPLRVDLRLVDADDRTWAARAYSPPGSLAASPATSARAEEFAALLAPAGTPPGVYTVTVGLSDASGTRSATLEGALLPGVPIGVITVTAPLTAPQLAQMPVNHTVRRPHVAEGLALSGAALPATPLLAGTTAALRLAAENLAPTPPQRALYVTLRDAHGAAAAEWQGWTLPNFPTALWPQGSRILIPVEIDLPPTLADGRYAVEAGWVDMATDARTPPVEMGDIALQRRAASFAPLEGAQPLEPAPRFGAHALLEGYTITRTGASLELALDWRVEQPLLPPHHIFVHADDPGGVTLAQSDGQPVTLTGPAPTGTWQPGEFLRTLHTLTLPADAPPLTLRVGLYNPATQVRLPVTIADAPAGDAVILTTLQ